MAAQRATTQPNQSLNVVVDGTVVGTIEPTSTTYMPYSVDFVVTGGRHTITLQGTQAANSTAAPIPQILRPTPAPYTPFSGH